MIVLRKSCFAFIVAVLVVGACSAEGANPRSGKLTLPVMTALTVKLDESLNLKSTANGAGFTASIKDPVQIDGLVVIPANSAAGGLVSKESAGSGEMQLNSIFVNGRMYRITTSRIPFRQKTSFRAGSTMTFYLVLSLNINR